MIGGLEQVFQGGEGLIDGNLIWGSIIIGFRV